MSFRLRNFNILCISFLMALAFIISDVNAREGSQDIGRPEPILFLLEARDAMKQYYEEHEEYPNQWHLLDITFANGPYHVTDMGIRPSKEDTNTWKPLKCIYTYEIKFAEKYVFLIQAINPEGNAGCLLLSGMDEPVINLMEENLFHEYYRPMVADVIEELIKDREKPSEFYVNIDDKGNNELIFPLWHQDAFKKENLNTVGNPGGKCRNFHYDKKQAKILKKLWWQ